MQTFIEFLVFLKEVWFWTIMFNMICLARLSRINGALPSSNIIFVAVVAGPFATAYGLFGFMQGLAERIKQLWKP